MDSNGTTTLDFRTSPDEVTLPDPDGATPVPTLEGVPATGGPVIELHWMTQPDIDMADVLGDGVALCGVWLNPDEDLAASVTSATIADVYVSCEECDRIRAGAA